MLATPRTQADAIRTAAALLRTAAAGAQRAANEGGCPRDAYADDNLGALVRASTRLCRHNLPTMALAHGVAFRGEAVPAHLEAAPASATTPPVRLGAVFAGVRDHLDGKLDTLAAAMPRAASFIARVRALTLD